MEGIFKSARPQRIAVCQINPLGSGSNGVLAANVPQLHVELDAFVSHQLKRPPRGGQVAQGFVTGSHQVLRCDLLIAFTFSISHGDQAIVHMRLKALTGRLATARFQLNQCQQIRFRKVECLCPFLNILTVVELRCAFAPPVAGALPRAFNAPVDFAPHPPRAHQHSPGRQDQHGAPQW